LLLPPWKFVSILKRERRRTDNFSSLLIALYRGLSPFSLPPFSLFIAIHDEVSSIDYVIRIDFTILRKLFRCFLSTQITCALFDRIVNDRVERKMFHPHFSSSRKILR